ncbi:DUF6255 family natural product biosynthesis protein [Streptomyces sp. NPDC051162]|uniref:DUF6255 family natural product biosynthesis protein n=1 Tax=Streptomyces sp. NPDC051162 TaxID=3154747 RepID=UPI0034359CBD
MTTLAPARSARDTAAATRIAVGRLVIRRCAHARGWSSSHGIDHCAACGMQRHTAYAPLRMPLPDRALDTPWGRPIIGTPGQRWRQPD